MSRILLLCALSFFGLLGCADGQQSATPQEKGVPAMQLTSTAFQDGGIIPKQCTADGKDISPALQWSGAPGVIKSFALICDDPDAPRGTWVHWVIFNLPADKHTFDENVPPLESLPDGAKQGKNDFGKIGYG